MTRYPNLLAEYEAGNYGHICTLYQYANVTEEVMKAVLYDGAELSEDEIKSIGNPYYLTDPELRYISEDDKNCWLEIARIVNWADEVKADINSLSFFEQHQFEKVKRLAEYYCSGEKIPLAIYRAGVSGTDTVKHALEPKKPPRTLNDPVINKKPLALPRQKSKKQENEQTKNEYAKTPLGIDSREVAKMVKKRHADLLRDIETYIEYMKNNQNADLRSDNFFIESSYNAGTGKKYKCFIITRKGCEMVANKMTGEKGVLFTATYINKFHEMEKGLATPSLPVVKNKRLEIQEKNARIRAAKMYLRIAENPLLPKEYRSTFLSFATKELSGQEILPTENLAI